MVYSSKTPTGKAKKGQVTVRVDSGSVKACFPRSCFNDGKQMKLATGISMVDGWEFRATQLQRRLQIELEEGKFDGQGHFSLGRYQEILKEYGLTASLRNPKLTAVLDDRVSHKPQLSLLEVWDMYCEYRKQGLRESHYEHTFQGQYKNYLQSAIIATKSEDAIKIRNWLIENRNLNHVKKLLSYLSKAYKLGTKNRLLSIDPYEGMTQEIANKGASGKTQQEIENDNDLLDQAKAYTWEEVQAILDYCKDKFPHWYRFLKFKFLTGCRTGEAVAFMWNDIEWDKERILIRRTYDKITKKFYPVKNDKTYKGMDVRRFPMPKEGELWMLLKSFPQGNGSEEIFKSKTGNRINSDTFGNSWRGANYSSRKRKGIIPTLIKQGKLTKYLSPYNTRHSFITHAIYDLGIDEKVVSEWCGHQIDLSNKHYRDVAIFAERINPEIPMVNHSEKGRIQMLEQQLAQQQELINKLLNNNQ